MWCHMPVVRQTFPGEIQHTYLFTPDREPMTDQNTDATKVQLGEPMNCIGVTGIYYRNVGESLFTGAEMTQRQLPHQSLPQHR